MTNRYPLTIIEEHCEATGLAPVVEQFHVVMAARAEELDVPSFSLTVVLSGNLTASIVQHGEPDFQAERLGGVVAGKTLARVRDYTEVDIVLDATPADDETHPFAVIERISLLTHEYCHAIIGRLRAVAGTRPAPPTGMRTPAEVAAIFAYEAADEYRCDLFANSILNAVTVSVDGSDPQPLTLADMFGDGYRDGLADVLDSTVHPGWPDLVDSYRRGRTELSGMFDRLVIETGHVLKLIAHADATAYAAGKPPVLADLAAHPAVNLYLDRAWTPIRQVIEATTNIPALAGFADADRALQAAGQGIVDLWGTLGVRGELVDDDQLYLHVSEPAR